MPNLNRRDFLKVASLTLATSFLKPFPPEENGLSKPTGLGRVTTGSIWAYSDPKPGAARQRLYYFDTVLPIYDSVSTVGLMSHNPVWNLTRDGWVYSSWVQPVKRQLNPVERDIPPEGFWAQVSMPYVDMRVKPDDTAYRLYRLYYSSVHLVVAQVEDAAGEAWYQIKRDQAPGQPAFVRAAPMRRILPAEMTPLSPDVADKKLEVRLGEQRLYAYENGLVVFSARCATGTTFTIEGEGFVDFRTSVGSYQVVRKRPSKQMSGYLGRPDQYDLPGVPFCTYFTGAGAAVHGAYWHNDFGHPRSHGCVNVLAEAAQWVYRWSMPTAAYHDALLEVARDGTPIVVV